MYDLFSEISSWLSGPFAHTARSSSVAFVDWLVLNLYYTY
jgi:hypothetical protein